MNLTQLVSSGNLESDINIQLGNIPEIENQNEPLEVISVPLNQIKQQQGNKNKPNPFVSNNKNNKQNKQQGIPICLS